MPNFFDHLFDELSRPLRREAQFQVSIDADGNLVYESVETKTTSLSPDGSIDSVHVVGFFHCGHVATDGIGGQCCEPGCRHISCWQCFVQSRCCICFKGLCLEHRRQVRTETEVLTLCGRCFRELMRRRRWRAIGRGLLSPFISFNPREKP